MNQDMGEFTYQKQETEPIGSSLYQKHLKLTTHIADFAGYIMPLWYSSISAEHSAVRESAGLFDCTHMGVFEAAGPEAAGFLNTLCTNDVSKISVGRAQYSYVLDAAGNVLDDIIIYQLKEEKFMVVVNAANEEKIKAYIKGLINNEVILDANEPDRKLEYKPEIRDLKDITNKGCRVDIALQGPASLNILNVIIEDKNLTEAITNLKPFRLIQTEIRGLDCIISRTGYTGASVGFELFVHPQKAPQRWNLLLEKGKESGLLPCGLGARDSLRIEAGLPLYGHELAGPFGITPFEAGYGWAVKLDKDFFIGKEQIEKKSQSYDMEVVRIELPGAKGIRPVREDDGVLNEEGECVGWVLSCAKVQNKQIALVYVKRDSIKENTKVGVYYLARSQSQIQKGKKLAIKKDEKAEADITGMGVSRFEKY
ncbi:MAG: glycine cleavage system aminomethyltransferase GcvT [Planctomycetota bacterium]